MGNGEAVNYICDNVNKYKFIKRMNIHAQGLNENSFRKILQMVEENESIQFLDFGV